MTRSSRGRAVALVVLVAALVAVEASPVLQRSLRPVIRFAGPVERAFARSVDWAGQAILQAVVGRSVGERFAALERELSAARYDQARLAILEGERRALHQAADFRVRHTFSTVTTRVIGRDPRFPATRLRLGLGAADGLTSGAAVLSPDGSFVGTVSDVGAAVSTVQLLASAQTKIPVRVVGSSSETWGLLTAPSGLSLQVDQVPRDAAVRAGDAVVTGTGQAAVPPNIPLGTILSTSASPEGLWQVASLAPLVDPTALDIVAVVVPQP